MIDNQQICLLSLAANLTYKAVFALKGAVEINAAFTAGVQLLDYVIFLSPEVEFTEIAAAG